MPIIEASPEYPISEYTEMKIWQFPWSAVIYFKNNKKINIFSAHLRILQELKTELENQNKRNG
jgi:hypothetical protein